MCVYIKLNTDSKCTVVLIIFKASIKMCAFFFYRPSYGLCSIMFLTCLFVCLCVRTYNVCVWWKHLSGLPSTSSFHFTFNIVNSSLLPHHLTFSTYHNLGFIHIDSHAFTLHICKYAPIKQNCILHKINYAGLAALYILPGNGLGIQKWGPHKHSSQKATHARFSYKKITNRSLQHV